MEKTIQLENLQTELEQLRAQKEAKLKSRQLSEEDELKREIEEEKRELAKLTLIEKFEAEYGELDKKISVLEMDNGEIIVVKAPAGIAFHRYLSAKNQTDPDTMKEFIKASWVYPEKSKMGALYDEYPALPFLLSNRLTKLAGLKNEDSKKK